MKTTLVSKTSRAAIKFVGSVIANKTTLPVLSQVHCYANGSFRMAATDLDITAIATCPAVSTRDGISLIPKSALVSAIEGKNDFEIEAGEKEITFRAGGNVHAVPRMATDEFPPMTEAPADARRLTFPAGEFLAAMRRVVGAISTDEARYVLNGVCLDIGAETVQLVATDGRRLHIAKLPAAGADSTTIAKLEAAQTARLTAHTALDAAHNDLAEAQINFPPIYRPITWAGRELFEQIAGPEVSAKTEAVRLAKIAADKADEALASVKAAVQVIIPRKAVKLILSIPLDKKAPGEITIAHWQYKDSHLASITAGDYSIVTKQIAGNYPNFRQVIPGDMLCTVKVVPAELAAAIEQAATVCTEKSNSVKFHLTKNLLTVTGKSDNGEASAKLSVNYHDKEMMIAFNPAYVIGVCDAAKDCAELVCEFIDELSPGRFNNAAGLLAVVMPMRLS